MEGVSRYLFALLAHEKNRTFQVAIAKKAVDILESLIMHLDSRVGAGLDNIDVECARKKGIEVLNVKGANALSVAEHTISFILALAKNLFDFDKRMRQGEWDIRYAYRAFEIQGKTLGLVGFGLIERETVRIALSLGMKVLFYDPFAEEGFELSVERVNHLDALLERSDFVCLHVPLSENTVSMIGERELKNEANRFLDQRFLRVCS
ncbi:MAG: NAD(P)-dependent oxidoreductase [Atribacterota bacterium]